MAKFLKTAISFTKNIKTTGAIGETSRFVEEEITSQVFPDKKQLVVEFGAGHGNITKVILNKMHPESRLIAFEVEDSFFEELQKINDPRLRLEHRSAGDIVQIAGAGSVDCIVSSIPITIIPNEIKHSILESAQKALRSGGTFTQVLYSKKLPLFKKYFSVLDCKLVLNFPPAFLHFCVKV